MKDQNVFGWLALIVAVSFSSLGLDSASANLNDKRAIRKMGGLFKGTVEGTQIINADPPFTLPLEPGQLRVKPPLERKKKTTTAFEDILPDETLITGIATKAKVRRCGKKIRVKENVTALIPTFVPDSPYQGTAQGSATKRGKKYAGKATIDVTADHTSSIGYIDRVILLIRGKG